VTPEQTTLVQRSFAQIVPIADTAAELFYGRLFELDPSLRPLFRGDMREQGRKLMQLLCVVVRGLDRPEVMLRALEGLGRRHANYGVTEAHFATVGAALLWTLEQGLGTVFTPEMADAWASVYAVLTTRIKDAMAEAALADAA
jgi:hemoglobin-like flavoprotein